jgi:P-type Ca2+ transporter type 2C
MDSVKLTGLSEAEALKRQATEGLNELPRSDRRTAFRIVAEVLREPMLALLLGSGLIYLLLGEPRDAVILLAFATISVGITVAQETRTERVLEALRDLTSPRALVIRDGQLKRIAGREVVRGDFVVISEGDRVPADALLVECHDVYTDESLLTGESVPVRKSASAAATGRVQIQRPGGDGLPYVFSGSLVVRGTGIGEVVAIGAQTEIGKIGQSLGALETEPPRLQEQTRRLVTLFGIGGGAVSVLAMILYAITRGGRLDALLAGIAIGMSMLPEEFPVVLTVFMAMGAWRISRARVLTRRAAAIETLGSATVLCTDKTGTLTENRMVVAELRLPDGRIFRAGPKQSAVAAGEFQELAELGALASARDPFDPMEKALRELARELAADTHFQFQNLELARTYGLRSDLLAMTQIWSRAGHPPVIASKGAPEAIAQLCKFDGQELAASNADVNAMAAEGLRVLAVARGSYPSSNWPESQHEFRYEYLGLVGLADPLRSSVPDAVEQCRTAGIRVCMITGDYPATAQAIARAAGLSGQAVLTGEQLSSLTDEALAQEVRTTNIFARILPEQKLRIVNALKAAGEIVAMTGDGVNDAPSLKAAHIGVAMGARGTDVAREASSIVLLDDDFGSIVRAIRLGRRIYDNLRKAMGFISAVHVPIAGLALLPLALGLPLIFGPVHIAFLEMVIDPVCALVFEAEVEERNVMCRPPRDPSERLFSKAMVLWSALQGVLALALVSTIFVMAHARAMPPDEVRALVFFSLVVTIIALIFVNRSFSPSPLDAVLRPNGAFLWVLAAVVGVLTASLAWPTASVLFRFGPLHADDLALTAATGILLFGVLEGLKAAFRSRIEGQD